MGRRYPAPVLLVLIRHGVTAATDGGVLVGWTPGIHLTDLGRGQAERLAARLEGVTIHSIYTSPLERCLETAAPLAAPRGLRVVTRSDLGEVRYGSWTGRNVKLLARTKLWAVAHQVPSRARFPGGESLLEVQHRMIQELERIAAAHPKQVVAVCSHADPIRLALAHFAGMPVDLYHRISVDTGSVSVLALGDGVPRILKVNDTGDLSVLAPPRARGRAQAKVRG
jgi:probable phosphomutase (TIGR03848 family)